MVLIWHRPVMVSHPVGRLWASTSGFRGGKCTIPTSVIFATCSGRALALMPIIGTCRLILPDLSNSLIFTVAVFPSITGISMSYDPRVSTSSIIDDGRPTIKITSTLVAPSFTNSLLMIKSNASCPLPATYVTHPSFRNCLLRTS